MKTFALGKCSTSMGYAAFLKPEFTDMKLFEKQRVDIFMNSLFVLLIQMGCILCIWKNAFDHDTFIIIPATSIEIMIARFLGSLMMHINVEKDVRKGLSMMKYAVNHVDNFTNVYPSFLLGYLCCIISLMIEANCMIILITLPNILDVITKYLSIVSIVRFPDIYFAVTDSDNRLLSAAKLQLPVTNFRNMDPLAERDWTIKLMRFIYKVIRVFFISISFYFNPFLAIIMNFKFMISYDLAPVSIFG